MARQCPSHEEHGEPRSDRSRISERGGRQSQWFTSRPSRGKTGMREVDLSQAQVYALTREH